MAIKVYDLAKEFGMQSKDFVVLLQQVNIPVKNHMSALTDQQEKYFRNNFKIVDNKIVPKSHERSDEAKNADTKKAEVPQQKSKEKIMRNAEEKKSAAPVRHAGSEARQQSQTAFRPSQNPAQQRQYDNRQPNRTRQAESKQSGYTRSNYQQKDSGRNANYQGRDGKPQPGYNAKSQSSYNRSSEARYNQSGHQNKDARFGGYSRPYGAGQSKDSNRQGSYQGRDSKQGTWNKDGKTQSSQSRNFTQRRPSPSFADKPLEKSSKIDKSKKDNKLKNEAKSKAKEKFFNDDRPLGKLDNTKRVRGSKSSYKKKKLADKEEKMTSGVTGTVILPETVTVSELAEKILISSAEIIKILMSYGIMANINQTIDFETASVVCEELEITVELEAEENIFEAMEEKHFAAKENLTQRPPIITVMGHVDHGKTSLLDYLRHTNVIKGEAGGITQHVGAYTVTANGKPITFIDTPGHEAFTAMRSRGASVTDIAVLVIAADDGIKPQTVEAINHAKAAKVPIIVAINKIDKPEANPEKVKQELTEYQIVPEDWGGDTICVNISAKTGEGIDTLLDMILLVAEVEDLKANTDLPAIGTVIEARIDKQRGITATLLVRSGVLNEGDFIVSGAIYGKVRTLINDKGERVSSLMPSMAAEMTGLSEVPSAGDKFFVAENEKEAKNIAERKKDRQRLIALRNASKVSLDDIFSKMSQGEIKQVELIVKADVQGSFEAISQALEKLNDNEDGIKVSVIHGGVGAVSESDVLLASASKALIVAFNVKTDNAARLAASKDGIEIRTYSVIYDLLDEIKEAMSGLKEPEYREVLTGEAEVRQVFKVPSIGMVAGSYVTDGQVKRSQGVRVIRDGVVIYTGKMSSLKRFKDDVKEVSAGYECGIGIEKFNDIKEGDKLEFFMNELVKE